MEALFLVRNGVPFDVAFSMDTPMRVAACIAFGRWEGGKWNWSQMAWEKSHD